MANRIGNALLNLGIAPASRVMMLLMDTPQFPATFFGTMRARFPKISINEIVFMKTIDVFYNKTTTNFDFGA
jgi:benzoate-CoA ligase